MDLPTLEAEGRFWVRGMRRVAGLDEVGRGAWAGPVVAAAVILPCDDGVHAVLEGVRDSKQVSPAMREILAARIFDVALAVGVGRCEHQEIDVLGIVPATRLAMERALAALAVAPEALVIDALRLPGINLPQEAFPCADGLSLSVAAASIIAKVARDRWMADVAEVDFPGYGFLQHKGYGTRQHREALARLGACPLHRVSFRPIGTLLSTD